MRVTSTRSRLRRRTALGAIALGVGGSFMFASPAFAVTVSAPTGVTATANAVTAKLVDVAWTEPASTTGIDHYQVTTTPSSGGCTAYVGETTCSVGSLTGGTEYTFFVTSIATSGNTDSAPVQAAATATPWDLPAAPTGLTFTATAATTGTLSWTAADLRGGTLTGYDGTATGGATLAACAGVTTLSCAVTTVAVGGSYTFSVTVTTDKGTSSAATLSTTMSVPDAPTSPSAVRSGTETVVSWTAPASEGSSAITSYVVKYAVGDKTIGSTACTSATTTCTVTGLTTGVTYSYTVTAVNGLGSSSATAVFQETTAAVPDTPAAPTAATASDTSVDVNWTAPADNGSAITGYTVKYASGGTVGDTACTTTTEVMCTVSGLTTGTGYTFTVMATNAVGDSAESAASNEAIPGTETPVPTMPDPPTGVMATPGEASATISWTAVTGASEYMVCLIGGAATECTASATTSDTMAEVMDLTNGVTYSAMVNVTTSGGTSDYSDAVLVTPGIPTAPTTLPASDGSLSSTSSTPTAGDTVTVSGSGFAANAPVVVTLYSDPVTLTTTYSDASGNLSVEVTIPPDTAAGSHTIVAQGYNADGAIQTLTVAVTIASAVVGPEAPTAGTNLLAITGGPVVAILLVGLVLIAGGAALLVTTSRKNGTTPFRLIKSKALSLAGIAG